MATDRTRAVRVTRILRNPQQQAAEHMRCLEANTRSRQIGRRGEANRRHLHTVVVGGIKRTYHVTKGWRTRRGGKAAA